MASQGPLPPGPLAVMQESLRSGTTAFAQPLGDYDDPESDRDLETVAGLDMPAALVPLAGDNVDEALEDIARKTQERIDAGEGDSVAGSVPLEHHAPGHKKHQRVEDEDDLTAEELAAFEDDTDANGEPLEGIFDKFSKKGRAKAAQRKADQRQNELDKAEVALKKKQRDNARAQSKNTRLNPAAADTEPAPASTHALLAPMPQLRNYIQDPLGLPALQQAPTTPLATLAAALPTLAGYTRGNTSSDVVALRVLDTNKKALKTLRVPVTVYTHPTLFKDTSIAVYDLSAFAVPPTAQTLAIDVPDRSRAYAMQHWQLPVNAKAAAATDAALLTDKGKGLVVVYASKAGPVATPVASRSMLAAEHQLADVLLTLDTQHLRPLDAAKYLNANPTDATLHAEAAVGLSAALAAARHALEQKLGRPIKTDVDAHLKYVTENVAGTMSADQAATLVAAIEDYAQALRSCCGCDDTPAQLVRGAYLGEHLTSTGNSVHHVGIVAQLADALALVQSRFTGNAADTTMRMARFWEAKSEFHAVAKQWFAS
jgi:hypothetical protein